MSTDVPSTVDHMMREFLTASTKHTAAACDPATPEADFRTHCALAQAYGLIAYVLNEFGNTDGDATELAWELHDFTGDGESLAEWVTARLGAATAEELIVATQGNPLPVAPLAQAADPNPACCDLGKTDPTSDDDGIVISFCRHRLEGDFERYWDDYVDDDDAQPVDPAKPLIYVSAVKRDPDDARPELQHDGCEDDTCPQTRLCQTHYADL
jgi:hypothetical protein